MRMDLLCSGSKGNSCLIRDRDTTLLIDCGSTKKYLMGLIERAGVQLEDLDGLLVTHTHTDHVSQIKHFKNKPIYSYCDIKDINDHRRVKPAETFTIGSLQISVIGLSHDSPDTVGYVIQSQEEKLVYITDTGFIPNRFKSELENADYYIFESNHDIQQLLKTSRPMFVKQRILGDSGHLCNEDSAHNLSQIVNTQTKEIVLAHLSEEANHPELALEVMEDTFRKQSLPLSGIRVRAASQFEPLVLGQLDLNDK